MSIRDSILLGLVHGLAEFLPVSSSGHLAILNNLFGMAAPEGEQLLFEAMLRIGTLFSLFVVYARDIAGMLRQTLGMLNLGPEAGVRRRRRPGTRLLIMILLGSLPLLLMMPLRNMLTGLRGNNIFVGVMLVLTGCILYVSDKMPSGKKETGGITTLDAVIIGLCQCVSLIPGISRTGTNMTAGLATGLNREFAVKFGLLLTIPAALISDIVGLFRGLAQGAAVRDVAVFAIGMSVAAVVGMIAVKLLERIAKRGRFGGFAYYCWVVGALTVILTLIF